MNITPCSLLFLPPLTIDPDSLERGFARCLGFGHSSIRLDVIYILSPQEQFFLSGVQVCRYFKLVTQLPSENQSINQFLAIREASCLWHSSDHVEAQLLPDTDRGWVIGENQVEDRVLVSLGICIKK